MLKSEFKDLYRQMRMGKFDGSDEAKQTGMQKYYAHEVAIIYTRKEGKEPRLYCRSGIRVNRDVVAATIDSAGKTRRDKPLKWCMGWKVLIDVARDFNHRHIQVPLP